VQATSRESGTPQSKGGGNHKKKDTRSDYHKSVTKGEKLGENTEEARRQGGIYMSGVKEKLGRGTRLNEHIETRGVKKSVKSAGRTRVVEQGLFFPKLVGGRSEKERQSGTSAAGGRRNGVRARYRHQKGRKGRPAGKLKEGGFWGKKGSLHTPI